MLVLLSLSHLSKVTPGHESFLTRLDPISLGLPDQISLYQWFSTIVHGHQTSKGGPINLKIIYYKLLIYLKLNS